MAGEIEHTVDNRINENWLEEQDEIEKEFFENLEQGLFDDFIKSYN